MTQRDINIYKGYLVQSVYIQVDPRTLEYHDPQFNC